jgi:Ca2+-binding EF-hand superfamily protein
MSKSSSKNKSKKNNELSLEISLREAFREFDKDDNGKSMFQRAPNIKYLFYHFNFK